MASNVAFNLPTGHEDASNVPPGHCDLYFALCNVMSVHFDDIYFRWDSFGHLITMWYVLNRKAIIKRKKGYKSEL